MALEAAGCIAVEMECVPAKVAQEITKRTKMLVFSMGILVAFVYHDSSFLFRRRCETWQLPNFRSSAFPAIRRTAEAVDHAMVNSSSRRIWWEPTWDATLDTPSLMLLRSMWGQRPPSTWRLKLGHQTAITTTWLRCETLFFCEESGSWLEKIVRVCNWQCLLVNSHHSGCFWRNGFNYDSMTGAFEKQDCSIVEAFPDPPKIK